MRSLGYESGARRSDRCTSARFKAAALHRHSSRRLISSLANRPESGRSGHKSGHSARRLAGLVWFDVNTVPSC